MSKLDIEDRDLNVCKIRPTADHVLVEVWEREESAGGLLLPKKERTECLYGKVLSMGAGPENVRNGEIYTMPFKDGDFILCMQYVGERVKIGWDNYRIVREHGVWAKLKIKGTKTAFEVTEIEPVDDKIVIIPRNEEKSRGGIYLPGDPKTDNNIGTVVSVGPGKRDLKTGRVEGIEVKQGEQVLFMRYAGAEIKVGKEKYRIIQEADVRSIFEETAA